MSRALPAVVVALWVIALALVAAYAIATLGLAQLRLQDQDHRIQCVILGRDLWTSSMSADRQRAMRLCTECPIQQECHDAAEARWEQRHIWGGRGFTRHPTERGARSSSRSRT